MDKDNIDELSATLFQLQRDIDDLRTKDLSPKQKVELIEAINQSRELLDEATCDRL